MTDLEKADFLRKHVCTSMVESGKLPEIISKFGAVSEWMLTDEEIIKAVKEPHKCNHKDKTPGMFGKCTYCEIALIIEYLFGKMATMKGIDESGGREAARILTAKEEQERGLVL